MQELEKIQENIVRKLGGSSTIAEVPVRGKLGWRKLEERREENKLSEEDFGQERYVKEFGRKGEVRLKI